jgi:endonuclease/exonuclease/phosphatase family metal-dependent hydrolase
LGQTTRFIGFHFGHPQYEDQLSICSFNSQSYNQTDHLSGFLAEIRGEHPLDFMCLQEVTDEHLASLKTSSDLAYHYFHKGKAVLSKYPIIDQGNIQFDQSVNGCIWIDVTCRQKTLRIYNLHLKSNQVTREAETVLDDINTNRTQALVNIQRMVLNYQKNSVTRMDQVQRILEDIRMVHHPMILAGDFNDTPFSFTYQQFSNQLVDQFKKKGLGIGSTYAGALPGLKIDYIFADEIFEPVDHMILKTAISDHFPVLSTMKLK